MCSLLLCACSKSIETAVINADGMTVQFFHDRQVPAFAAVYCGAWQIPGEGRSLYLFTNYSDRTVTLGIEPVDIRKGIPSEYTFRPGEVLSVEVTR